MLVLLDTDVCISLINRRPGFDKVLRRLSGRSFGEICLSSITVSELEYGVANSARTNENKVALEEFLARFELLDYPIEAARHYGKLRAELERAGTPIGANDLLIGAHAMAIKASVVTGNVSEFSRIKGLKTLDWFS